MMAEDFFSVRSKNKDTTTKIFAGWVVGLTLTGLGIFGFIYAIINYGWLPFLCIFLLSIFILFVWALWYLLHKAKDKNEVSFDKSSRPRN